MQIQLFMIYSKYSYGRHANFKLAPKRGYAKGCIQMVSKNLMLLNPLQPGVAFLYH